jgi:hypothetical protein
MQPLERVHERVHEYLSEQYEPVTARDIRDALGFKSRAWMLAKLSELTHLGLVDCVGTGPYRAKLWVAMDPIQELAA